MKSIVSVLLSALLFSVSPNLPGKENLELSTRPVLNLAVSKAIAAADHAAEHGWGVNIAIVDEASDLVYFERGDGVQRGSIEVAIRKAKTAAAFRLPTRVLSEMTDEGMIALVSVPDALLLEGGVPIAWNGEVIGAIGVSGVTSEQDGQIGQAGADALAGILAGE